MNLDTECPLRKLCVSGLFGEGPAERRGRLRQLLAVLGEDAVKQKKAHTVQQLQKKDEVYNFD